MACADDSAQTSTTQSQPRHEERVAQSRHKEPQPSQQSVKSEPEPKAAAPQTAEGESDQQQADSVPATEETEAEQPAEAEQQVQTVAEKSQSQVERQQSAEAIATSEAEDQEQSVATPQSESQSEDAQERDTSQPAASSEAQAQSEQAAQYVTSEPQTAADLPQDDNDSTSRSSGGEAASQPSAATDVETVGKGGGDGVPAGAVGGSGETYTWQDGDQTRSVTLQTGVTVVENERGEASVVRSEVAGVQGASGQGGDGQPATLPVFQSDTGQTMILPGGVLLVFDPEWGTTQINQFFQSNNVDRSKVHERTFTTNAFFIETDPGFPSLNLANALAGQEGVVLSSPNWQTEVEAQ